MTRPIAKTTLALAASLFFLAGTASADPWNKKTYVTFPNTVELPGRVMIPPGTYTMKVLDSQSNRYTVQVQNRDENKTYAVFHTIPKYRMDPADDTIITFYETPGSAPRFIHTWFYPGDTIGREFTYSKDRADYIASLNGGAHVAVTPGEDLVASRETVRTEERTTEVEPFENPIVTEQDPERTAGGGDQLPEPAPAITDADTPEQPEQQAVDEEPLYAQATPPADDQAAQRADEPETLPSTASELPMVALAGVILIGLGAALRRVH